ncbi:MAG: ABC transporter ATP-binding protein [Chloroflexi bacterium]|nr:MAG: ABC transporter ATP-binding protein [Chloroflexota bacterium]
MIDVQNLSKYFGDTPALQEISFNIQPGEVVGVLGPAGAGKTTLLRILTTYLPPSRGTARIAGFDICTHSLEVRRRIGYLPADAALDPAMTVGEYLAFMAALRRLPNRRQRVAEILAQFELGRHTQTRIAGLSAGDHRRLALAQAVLHSPEVLLLDEPTAGLSPTQLTGFHSLLAQTLQGRTVLLSTANLSDVERFCRRVLILHKGQIMAEDTPAGLNARLQGEERIRLHTLNAPANALEVLQSLPDVQWVYPVSPNIFDIECTTDTACRPVLAQLVVEQGWGLLELRPLESSLEEFFIELTTAQRP